MYVYFCRVGSLSKIHQSNQNLRLGLFLGSCVLHERGFAAIGINVKRRFCSIRSKYFVKVSRKSVKECQIIVMLRSDISFFFGLQCMAAVTHCYKINPLVHQLGPLATRSLSFVKVCYGVSHGATEISTQRKRMDYT